MNARFARNYKLLLEDLADQIKYAKNMFKKSDEELFARNRLEVLYLYRHMLKNIPPMHKSLLEKRCAYEVYIS
jgi:hypothetical protein